MGYPIASRVKSCRNRLGWTEGGLAQRSGVTAQGIAEIERAGRMPTVPELVGIAMALGVACDDLLGLKLPATVTVGSTTVTIGVRIKGCLSDDRAVMERLDECRKAIEAALSGPVAPPEGSIPSEYRELHEALRQARNQGSMWEARATEAEAKVKALESYLSIERQETGRLRSTIARFQTEGGSFPS